MHPPRSASMTRSRRHSGRNVSRSSSRSCASSKSRSWTQQRVADRNPARPPASAPGDAIMSLYGVQKLIFQLNRDAATRQRYEQNFDGLLAEYELSEEELR